MASLQIHHPDGRRPAEVPLTKAEAFMGRDPGCEIPLDDTVISRRHARVYRDTGGRYWVQDLGSKNGTLVNTHPVTISRLHSGDQIAVGGFVLTFIDAGGASIVMSDSAVRESTLNTRSWTSNDVVPLAQRRLEKLYELYEQLSGKFDRDELLNEILQLCAESFRFERAGVGVRHEDSLRVEWIKIKRFSGRRSAEGGTDESEEEIRISGSLVERALRDGERILINDTANQQFDPTQSMIQNKIRSAMCVPMEYLQKAQGVIYGDRVSSTGSYTDEDIAYFSALGRLAAMGLANVRLVQALKHEHEVATQLRWARDIQSKLLPAEPLQLPARDGMPAIEIDALNDPGQGVSGDYYDYFVRPDGKVLIVIADVSGKGIPASLLMANLQAAVQVTLQDQTDLAAAVCKLNRLVCRNVAESRFITALFALVDPATHDMVYVNAGHLAPFVLRAGQEVEMIPCDAAFPLGVVEDYEYAAVQYKLGDGPLTIVFYTDGVPDAQNEQGDAFGDARFVTALEASRELPPKEVIERARRSIKQYTRNSPQTDDITLVAMRWGT